MPMPLQIDPALRELLLRHTGDPSGDVREELQAREVPVVARLRQPTANVPGLRVVARFGEVVTGRLPVGEVISVRSHPNVASLKASLNHAPDLDQSIPDIGLAPSTPGQIAGRRPGGRGVVVGVLDWGFDFAHANFRNPDGSSRLLCLWDQRGGATPRSPAPFGYGREFTREDVDAALTSRDPYGALDYDPTDADPGTGSHGTHVADIAAGNGRAPGAAAGVAPAADLMFVHLRGDDTAPQDTLGDSVRLLEGARYVADRAGDRPVVINMSLGRTGGPHDGSTLVEMGLDALLRERRGRMVVMSAGNYYSAGLASHGRVPQDGRIGLGWLVPPRDRDTAEMEVWYSKKDEFLVELVDPRSVVRARVPVGHYEVVRDRDRVLASLYHRRDDPNNGDRQVDVFLWPEAPEGEWTVRLYGRRCVTGSYHAWIERTRPASQSRFSPGCVSLEHTIGSICGGRMTVSVGAYDARVPSRPLMPFSSEGPSRDARLKPNLCAPGGGVRAARSSQRRGAGRDKDATTIKSGASMAAPHVAGVVALMFEAAHPRRLSAAATKRLLRDSARSAGTEPPGRDLRRGWGRLDAQAALAATRGALQLEPVERGRRARSGAFGKEDRQMWRSGWETQSEVLEWLGEAVTPPWLGGVMSKAWPEVEPKSEAGPPGHGFEDLLRRLRVSERTFRPHEARYFSALDGLLGAYGVIAGGSVKLGRDNFTGPVRAFQQARGLPADGLPGPDTLWELQVPPSPILDLVHVSADVAAKGGLDGFWLRSDVAPAYVALRREIALAGAMVTSAGSLRDLDAPVSAGRSSTSLHYTGIALDLATDSGMKDTSQPYLVTASGDRRWRVWARSGQGTERTLDAVLWSDGSLRTERVTARVVDFTGIATRHGFLPIRHRTSFPGVYRSAEWWHFQYERALTPFVSLFGIELLRIYRRERLEAHPSVWERRKALWQASWF